MDFKDFFDYRLVDEVATRVGHVYPKFDQTRFIETVGEDLLRLDMKRRVQRISDSLWQALSLPYENGIPVLLKAIEPIPSIGLNDLRGFPVWPVAKVIEDHGQGHFDVSMHALHQVTQHFTGEFAVRPFLEASFDKTVVMLRRWREDESRHVRRLVSEGCRSRLPWAGRVSKLLEYPEVVLDLIGPLRSDSSEYVRRSVANNLNDISKDHPDLVVDTIARWCRDDQCDTVEWVYRHGLRSLVKRGHLGALGLLGYKADADVQVERFCADPAKVRLGDSLTFLSDLKVLGCDEWLMVDLKLRLPGAGAKPTRRTLKWTKRLGSEGTRYCLGKSFNTAENSTRKHYAGPAEAELLVNGQVRATAEFELLP